MRGFFNRLSGMMLNAIGAPGFVHATACQDRLGVPVEVSVGKRFTVIAVRNVRLFFNRISGQFDGVSIENTDCTQSASPTPSPPR